MNGSHLSRPGTPHVERLGKYPVLHDGAKQCGEYDMLLRTPSQKTISLNPLSLNLCKQTNLSVSPSTRYVPPSTVGAARLTLRRLPVPGKRIVHQDSSKADDVCQPHDGDQEVTE